MNNREINVNLINATPHPLNLNGIDLPSATEYAPPRAKFPPDRNRSILHAQTYNEMPHVDIPLVELDFAGLEDKSELEQWRNELASAMGSSATKNLIITSSLAAQAAVMSGLAIEDDATLLGYPADIRRNPTTGKVVGAESIHIPQPARMTRSGNPGSIARYRRAMLSAESVRIVNKTPDKNLAMQRGNKTMHIPVETTAEPMYKPKKIGQAAVGGTVVYEAYLTGMHNQPEAGVLSIVHPKAYFAYWLLTGNARIMAQMAIPHGIPRDKSGQQGQRFKKLAYFSPKTLERIQQTVGF